MATVKITVTLESDQVDSIRELVAAGRAASVSGFVQHAVRTALFDAAPRHHRSHWRQPINEEKSDATLTANNAVDSPIPPVRMPTRPS
jgi:Arc/MetJ-type ribon-helix-helix transcriptional regulator